MFCEKPYHQTRRRGKEERKMHFYSFLAAIYGNHILSPSLARHFRIIGGVEDSHS